MFDNAGLVRLVSCVDELIEARYCQERPTLTSRTGYALQRPIVQLNQEARLVQENGLTSAVSKLLTTNLFEMEARSKTIETKIDQALSVAHENQALLQNANWSWTGYFCP